MVIEGCAYEDLDEAERFFVTVEAIICGNCGSLQQRSGLVVYAGHLENDSLCAEILVWTKPMKCFYCDHIIRDLLIPCGDYLLNLETYELPSAI
jgi:hypothetical protein